MAAQTQVISKGERIPPTKQPFLGVKRINKVISACNAVIGAQVRVTVVASSGDPIIDAQTLPVSDWTFDAHGNSLVSVVVPVPQASSGTNASGWHWPAGQRNYDPSVSYIDQQVVYVQASSSVVTSGVTDPDSGLVVKSLPGIWVALKAVPASSNHIPHLPLPVPDDMNNSLNYWAFVASAPTCV